MHAFLKIQLKKSHLTAEDFSDDWQYITEWLINDKKRFRSHGEEWKIEFEEDQLGYFTAHLRRYDRDGNIILSEIHPQDILVEQRQFIYEQIEHFISTHDPTHIHGHWHFCVCASIIYENVRNGEEVTGGYSNLLYRDEDTAQIHRNIDFSRHQDYDKMIDYVVNNWIQRGENLSREGSETNSRDLIIKYVSEIEIIFWPELGRHDLNAEEKIEEKVGEHVNEVIIPREARGAGAIPKPKFYQQKGIIDPPSDGLKKCFQTAVCYCDAWSKRGKNNTISKRVLEETRQKYSWDIPDQPTKQDLRKWEKDNNVVLGVWTITNQTEKMTVEEFVSQRRTWIVHQEIRKRQKEKISFSCFLDFHLYKRVRKKMNLRRLRA